MTIHFRAPNPDAFSSGGNLYNRHLALSLRELGQDITFQSKAFGPSEKHDFILWDTLFLSSLLKASTTEVGQSVLIVHSDQAPFYQHLSQLVNSPLKFILPGQYMAEVLFANGVSPERCYILEPGFEGALPVKSSVNQLPVKLILIGNLTFDKGIIEFLHAIQSIRIANTGLFSLHIYGDDRIEPDYADQCHRALELGSLKEWITFQGVESHDQLMNKLGEYHGMLSVSPRETFGMAIREARMAGIPVLGVHGGNIPNLIQHKEDGLLFQSRDLLVEYLLVQLRDPGRFLHRLTSFHPGIIVAASWIDQANRLLSWLHSSQATAIV